MFKMVNLFLEKTGRSVYADLRIKTDLINGRC